MKDIKRFNKMGSCKDVLSRLSGDINTHMLVKLREKKFSQKCCRICKNRDKSKKPPLRADIVKFLDVL